MTSARKRPAVSSGGAGISICIVGAGIRGLGVLERIVAYSKRYASPTPVRVHLVDPSGGPQQYATNQPDYLLLNIVCAQVSMFPERASLNACELPPGPNLHEWVRGRGLLLGEDGFTVGQQGRPIEGDDFLPRRLLGEYLEWFRVVLTRQAPPYLEILEYKSLAMDLRENAERFLLDLSDGKMIEVDYLFITVGRLSGIPKANRNFALNRRAIRPYPLPDQVALVGAGETIAIMGLGLTAVDAILSLTIGRSGRIHTHDGLARYLPSGSEPRIVAFSRSGLPYRSRPALNAPLEYDPVAFTRSSIDALRAERGSKLDYDLDVLPLLLTELRVAYWRAWYRCQQGSRAAEELMSELRASYARGHLESYLTALESDNPAFDPQLAYFGSIPPFEIDQGVLEDTNGYQAWYRRWLEYDLEQARLGVAYSPLKAALEVCRECRDVIRYAVEFGGLTEESSDRFYSLHAEALNRIGVGPQKERTADLLALIDAGVLSVPLGPNPTVSWDEAHRRWKLRSAVLGAQSKVAADWLYFGASAHSAELTNDPYIVGAMARRGYLRSFRPSSSVVHAVDIDRSYHPVSQSGRVNSRIWVLGLLCEGVTFYNGYVTSPARFVRSQHDADRAVAQIFQNSHRQDRMALERSR